MGPRLRGGDGVVGALFNCLHQTIGEMGPAAFAARDRTKWRALIPAPTPLPYTRLISAPPEGGVA